MIEFRAATKEYPGGARAADHVDLVVPEGKVLAMVGSSGSGKTTLLRMVNRMVEPTSGAVFVDGRDVRSVDPVALRRSIGYVMQAGGLLPHRTVVDNVATVPLLNGVARREARAAAVAVMERVGLPATLKDRYPAQLSGGQHQRVGVARALAADPKILLMDEPFGAVDRIVRLELQEELRRLQAELGKTVILVTHDIDEAFALGDSVAVLQPGGVVAQHGTPARLLAAPASNFVAELVGAHSARRQLHLAEVDGKQLVLDADGRPAGVLAP